MYSGYILNKKVHIYLNNKTQNVLFSSYCNDQYIQKLTMWMPWSISDYAFLNAFIRVHWKEITVWAWMYCYCLNNDSYVFIPFLYSENTLHFKVLVVTSSKRLQLRNGTNFIYTVFPWKYYCYESILCNNCYSMNSQCII